MFKRILLASFVFASISFIAHADDSIETSVRWKHVEFTEVGNHEFVVPHNVDMIWVYGCGGGGAAKVIKLKHFNGRYSGEGAMVMRESILIAPHKKIIVTVGAGGVKNTGSLRGGAPSKSDPSQPSKISFVNTKVSKENPKVSIKDTYLETILEFPGGKGAGTKKDGNGGNSRGLGGKPGQDAFKNSCAGGGSLGTAYHSTLGNGGSGYMRVSWPVYLDRSSSMIERIDELSLRDLLTEDELDELKSDIKEEILRELTAKDLEELP